MEVQKRERAGDEEKVRYLWVELVAKILLCPFFVGYGLYFCIDSTFFHSFVFAARRASYRV